LSPSSKPRYSGKVVMLINEQAISAAEHTCLAFSAATDVTFIGTPTVGSDGDITDLVLPGKLHVSFSGHDVRHGDGLQLQRVGVQPHVTVAPTIEGIREGRDEVLEAAVKYLQAPR
jgi:C-terminal processing protease CtpA/Prc